jgi:hypothetical protein
MADRQVIVRRQDRRHRAGITGMPGIMPGPEGGVIPGRRHDAADQTLQARI